MLLKYLIKYNKLIIASTLKIPASEKSSDTSLTKSITAIAINAIKSFFIPGNKFVHKPAEGYFCFVIKILPHNKLKG